MFHSSLLFLNRVRQNLWQLCYHPTNVWAWAHGVNQATNIFTVSSWITRCFTASLEFLLRGCRSWFNTTIISHFKPFQNFMQIFSLVHLHNPLPFSIPRKWDSLPRFFMWKLPWSISLTSDNRTMSLGRTMMSSTQTSNTIILPSNCFVYTQWWQQLSTLSCSPVAICAMYYSSFYQIVSKPWHNYWFKPYTSLTKWLHGTSKPSAWSTCISLKYVAFPSSGVKSNHAVLLFVKERALMWGLLLGLKVSQ